MISPHGVLRAPSHRRNFLRIDRLRGEFQPTVHMHEIISFVSRFDAAFVNKAPESVTLTWIESEDATVQMSGQQELVLA
jgi:hypothetical protein